MPTKGHLFDVVKEALGLKELRVVETGGNAWQAQREQWDDGNNVVALEPGVVVAYDRNTYTNTLLRKAASRSSRCAARTRPRAAAGTMTCPISRDPALPGPPRPPSALPSGAPPADRRSRIRGGRSDVTILLQPPGLRGELPGVSDVVQPAQPLAADRPGLTQRRFRYLLDLARDLKAREVRAPSRCTCRTRRSA